MEKVLEKGDIVMWEGQEYHIEDIRDIPNELKNNPDILPGEKLYTICLFDPVAGGNLKVICHKLTAKPGEWKDHK